MAKMNIIHKLLGYIVLYMTLCTLCAGWLEKKHVLCGTRQF